jgi:2-methylcitrate dehydratase PrpD
MRWLLSYTAQLASGLASWQRDTEHVEKAFDFGGMPAKNGVTAALLVEAGGSGVDDVLSGVDNFFQAFVPKNDPSMLVDKLGERYEITRTNVKKWTVGAPIQAPLDALENLLKKHRFEADQVKQAVVRVATNEARIVNNREIPDICLQHLCAVMLVDKTVTFKSAHDTPRMKDPAILRQRAKVQLVPDEALERFLPRRAAIVEVSADGRQDGHRAGGRCAGHVREPDDPRRDHRQVARPDHARARRRRLPETGRSDLRSRAPQERSRAAAPPAARITDSDLPPSGVQPRCTPDTVQHV